MSNFLQRSITGFLFVGILFLSILSHPLVLCLLFCFFAQIATQELLCFFKIKQQKIFYDFYFLLFHLILFVVTYMVFIYHFSWQWYLVLLPIIGLLLVISLFLKSEYLLQEIALIFFAKIYISLPFVLAFTFCFFRSEVYYADILIGFFMLIWTCDSGAYVSGKTLGKHLLLPKISPKKTWEGAVGGFLFTLLMAYVLSIYLQVLTLTDWLILASIIAVFGPIGDLLESQFKRQAQLKDSGTILPGHGGILDRFDAFLLSSYFVCFYLLMIKPLFS